TKLNVSERTDCAGDPTCGGDGIPDPAPDAPAAATFWAGSANADTVFLSTSEALTDDADVSSAQKLCRYTIDPDGAGHHLTFVSANQVSPGTPVEVTGVLGAS